MIRQEIGGNQYIVGTYHGYFDEDVITVMAPVTEGFSTKGYLLLHSPVSFIDEKCHTLMIPIYISLGVIYLLSFIFLLGFISSYTGPSGRSQRQQSSMPPEIWITRFLSTHMMRWGTSLPPSIIWRFSLKTWTITRKRSWQMSPTTSAHRSPPSKGMWRP